MIKTLPPEIILRSLVNRLRHIAEVGGHMMLESFAANVLEQFLQLRNLSNTRPAKCLQGIIGELAWPGVPANHATPIIGRVARVAHGSGFHLPNACSKRILLAH